VIGGPEERVAYKYNSLSSAVEGHQKVVDGLRGGVEERDGDGEEECSFSQEMSQKNGPFRVSDGTLLHFGFIDSLAVAPTATRDGVLVVVYPVGGGSVEEVWCRDFEEADKLYAAFEQWVAGERKKFETETEKIEKVEKEEAAKRVVDAWDYGDGRFVDFHEVAAINTGEGKDGLFVDFVAMPSAPVRGWRVPVKTTEELGAIVVLWERFQEHLRSLKC
jgi:hypothetical protein